MRLAGQGLLGTLLLLALFGTPPSGAQFQSESNKTSTHSGAEAKKANTDAYIALLRRDVRQEKAEIVGAMMVLSAQDSAKFWPIYSEYEAALTKLNDLRLENLKEYAHKYDEMSDAEADGLTQKAMEYQRQRAELVSRRPMTRSNKP